MTVGAEAVKNGCVHLSYCGTVLINSLILVYLVVKWPGEVIITM
jgi:hypothetical protein